MPPKEEEEQQEEGLVVEALLGEPKEEEEEKQEEVLDVEALQRVPKQEEEKQDELLHVENSLSEIDESGHMDDEQDDDDKDKEGSISGEVVSVNAPWSERMYEVFTTFWPLGLVAFGGPQAHVAILHDHLVVQRGWFDEETFGELFAIGQGLPGPTSTQLVISAALSRAGPLGGLMAFFLWNIPGLVVLTACGVVLDAFVDPNDPPFYLVGLPPAAISLVFKAFYGMGMYLDTLGICLALMSCMVTILINGDENISSTSSQFVFPVLLAIGGIIALLDSKRKNPLGQYGSPSRGWDAESDATMKRIGIPLWVGASILFFWATILTLAICLVDVANIENVYLQIFETMYRVGSIIYGGGQVVLPLLQDEVVPAWMTKDQFLQGLGLAQSMPGPLFNFSAYLGAVYKGVSGAMVAWSGLFGPGVLLIFAVVPFWARLRHIQWFKVVLKGVNAAAIGLVGAACIILWEAAIRTAADAMVFCFALTLAVAFNIQAPFVILAGGILGAILSKEALNLGKEPYCAVN
jgi:chromate transporter